MKIWKIWIGDNPIPDHFKQYTDTWSKISKGNIVEINNTTITDYMPKELFDDLKEKFNGNNQLINHFVRYYLMECYGGIYLDLDVEVIKDSDIWYSDIPTFFCETDEWYNNHVMVCKSKDSHIYWELLDATYNHDMNDPKKEINTGPGLVTKVLNKEKENVFNLYAPEYTTPWNWNEKADRSRITDKTIAVHHFCHSWKK